ncbi:MAG: nucleoside triphosphatase I C-terminal domain-containing protein [Myxococcota bacterium]
MRTWVARTLEEPTSDLWDDYLKESSEDWHCGNEELKRLAQAEDDQALATLIARDIRYLASEYVAARLLEAQLTIWLCRDEALMTIDEGLKDPSIRAVDANRERVQAQSLLNALAT